MKTNILAVIRRAVALFRIRSLEIQLDGQNQAMQCDLDEETRIAISLARVHTRRQLAKERGNYLSMLPVGERRTWRAA